MTIHNLAYQGIFPPVTLSRLGLPPSAFSPDGVEYYGNMSFLKGRLVLRRSHHHCQPQLRARDPDEPLGMGMQGCSRIARPR